MKLYLSSSGTGGDPTALRDLVGRPGRAALIFNARDGYGPGRLKHLKSEFGQIGALGFACEELDLRTYFDDFEGLRARLAGVALIWVVGGNTFVLARAMSQARFADAIFEELLAGQIVYGGYSAGACVLGPDLDGCHLMDEPDLVPDGYSPDVAPNPLAWLPWRIVPHWNSDHEESPRARKAVEYLLHAGLPFQALRDGQVFVADTVGGPLVLRKSSLVREL